MMIVFAMAAAVWGIGMAMGAPTRQRWAMVGALMAMVVIIQLVLPDGHPLREATGGDIRVWLLLAALFGIVSAYRVVLRRVREKANSATQQVQSAKFSDSELERYGRHIVLREIGGPGQKALKNAKVLVVGAGGPGSPALQYLGAGGVGTIGVIDDDVVENTNLQRQVIHLDSAIGTPKVQSAADMMRAQNPFVNVQTYHRRLSEEIAKELIDDFDLVLDGTDNFETRYLVNKTCAQLAKPLIAAALSQWEGQISVYDPANGTPCYACVFPNAPDPTLAPRCAEAGGIGPLPGVMGSMMAVEAIKVLTNAGETLKGRMMIFDALYAQSRVIKISANPACSICHPQGAQS